MKKTAPLSTPTSRRSRLAVVGGDLGAELENALRKRALVDEDFLDCRVQLTRLSSSGPSVTTTASSYPGADATPGTSTTSSPLTTSGQASRSDRGILARTKRSCTLRPAGQPVAGSPAADDEPGRARLEQPSSPPDGPVSRVGERSSQTVEYSRIAVRPPPRSTRFEPSRDGAARLAPARPASGRAPGPRGLQEVSIGCRVQAAEQAAGSRSGSGRASCPGSTIRRPELEPLVAAVGLGLLTPDTEQRPDDAVVAAHADARRAAARGQPVDDRLDLVGGGVARRPQRAPAGARSATPEARLRRGPHRDGRPLLRRSRSAQKRASASDSAPRSAWFTWMAETR